MNDYTTQNMKSVNGISNTEKPLVIFGLRLAALPKVVGCRWWSSGCNRRPLLGASRLPLAVFGLQLAHRPL